MMRIEVEHVNGRFTEHNNVISWYISHSERVPLLYIAETPSHFGKKETYINLNTVIRYDVIDDSKATDSSVVI